MKSLVVLLTSLVLVNAASADLNIYTDRSTELLGPIVEQYEASTGIQVNVLTMKYKDMIKRLKTEGERTPVDVIFVKDMVYLNELAAEGMFQPMTTEVPKEVVAASMRHPENLWTSIAIRPRTIVYNKNTVNPEDLSTYASLAQEKWMGKLCLRTSASSYNVALVSSFIANYGQDMAQVLLEGYMDNLATVPFRSDRAVLDAIAAGDCEVGIVNSYYLAGKIAADPTFPVGIVFAGQERGGVHVNGTGAGISVHSAKVQEASDFIELMLSKESQKHFSGSHLDYPARTDLIPETLVKDWGVFNAETVNWSVLGQYHEAATNLVEVVGYE